MTRIFVSLTQVLVAVAVARTSLSNTITTAHDRTAPYLQATTESLEHRDEVPPTLQPTPFLREDCVSPYLRIAGQCLSIQRILNVTWEGARVFCRALDGDLVVAGSFQDLLLGYVNAYSSFMKMFRFMWIGASRPDAHSSFRWLDGSDLPPLTSPLWDYQDNDNYNCVYLGLYLNKSYKYRNADCKGRSGVVCQCLFC
ncbi:C-type lectin domain family 1 member A-like [Penaeus chinensis]|uniref:C-type lectin domain family 1 member A-like n=1 Tax=Penaeus chinensis TaxID=139456 RepID=UPI001FB85275|nr:C-type lectin domain family 1 member A-like [Penaeus chinensis]